MISSHQNILKVCALFIGLLTNIPYGLMLGWPSPTFPTLISAESPVPITLDQSALVAGFLTLGYISSMFTPSLSKYTEYGVVTGVLFMLGGWLTMYMAFNFETIIVSRFLIGLGYGINLVHLKHLINEVLFLPQVKLFDKIISCFVLSGFVLSYIIGPRVSFKLFSIICVVVTTIIFTCAIVLPIILLHIRSNCEKNLLSIKDLFICDNNNVISAIKKGLAWRRLLVIVLTSFLQQFCGFPASLVYTQLIFKLFGLRRPEDYALVYAIIYCFVFLICLFSERHSKINCRVTIIVSSIFISLCLCAEAAVLFFDVDKLFWSYTSFSIMILFCICHTAGISTVTGRLTVTYFEDSDVQKFASNCQLFCLLIFALTGTKTFQIILGLFGLTCAFLFCLCISLLFIVFAILFI
ncbi:uncharacterized protein LOC108737241 [Agrilus planipennis]|uniref:Uncharacterized protein LOC108737241 n=1 Tax=Agrilus planipennis TaxID=224129 RepID=A0A1W4WNH3_AGRPL|nr:uncharacterized protein LOC108737241 [Agrilus planipennis]